MAGSTVFFKTISIIKEKEKLQELFRTKGDYMQHCPWLGPVLEKRKCWNKEKHTEKIKEAGSRRESLFHDYGKRISHRGIKSGTTYYTHQQCSYQISINEIQDNSQDHVVQLLNLLNAEKMGSERVVHGRATEHSTDFYLLFQVYNMAERERQHPLVNYFFLL